MVELANYVIGFSTTVCDLWVLKDAAWEVR